MTSRSDRASSSSPPPTPSIPVQRRTGLEWGLPITIGDDAWLATGVIVCPGVTIGPGCVIGAGSVVTRDMPERHLCFGNPCRPVRPIAEPRRTVEHGRR